jgi:hypothetical protein
MEWSAGQLFVNDLLFQVTRPSSATWSLLWKWLKPCKKVSCPLGTTDTLPAQVCSSCKIRQDVLQNGGDVFAENRNYLKTRRSLPSGLSKSKSHYDRRSVGQFILVSCPFWSKWPDVTFIWVPITFFILHVGRPLWREDGSVICSAMTQDQFQVTLRPTVCRPDRLGAGPPMGPITRF